MTPEQLSSSRRVDRINVLFVDDDAYGTAHLTRELEYDDEFLLTTARSPQAALNYIADHKFDIVVTDRMMPPDKLPPWRVQAGFLSGAVLAQKIKEHRPETKIVMISNAQADENVASLFRNRIIEKYYRKAEITPGYFVNSLKRIIRNVSGPARIFVVHGHDADLIIALKEYVQNNLGWPEPVILNDLPSATRTIIEKMEDQASDTDVVFVLLTKNDNGPRGNVLFELGFFIGKFGRRSGRIVLLKQGDIELPSDLHGVLYIDVSEGLKDVGIILRKEFPYYFPERYRYW